MLHVIAQTVLQELLARCVDAHAERRNSWKFPLPGDELAAGLFEHPRPQWNNETRFLCHREEVVRLDQALPRMVPARGADPFQAPGALRRGGASLRRRSQ